MRGLKAAVVIMGVLIVAGVVTLGVAISSRLNVGGGQMTSLVLDEPAGTRIVSATAGAGDRLALVLNGAGPDRVVVVDTRSGKVAGRVVLAR